MPATSTHSAPAARAKRLALDERIAHRAGAMRWEIHPDLIAELFDGPRLRIDEHLRAGSAEIVKTGPHRTVYRLSLACGVHYLKHCRVTGWTGLLQNLVRPCKAAREADAARRIEKFGIRTCEIRGVGRTLVRGLVGDSFLLTRGIENVVGLDLFAVERLGRHPPRRQTQLRQRVARRAGELAARLHHGGALHRDFHSENLLVQVDRDDVSLSLIDLHPVDFVRRPTARQVERNLSLLANFLWRHTRPVDRLRFARAWWETFLRLDRVGPGGPRLPYADFREFVRRAGRCCYRGMLCASETADRRWIRGNRKLVIADASGSSIACRGVAELGREWIEATRDDPERLLDGPGVRNSEQFEDGTRIAAVTCQVAGLPLRCTCRAAPLDAKGALDGRWTPARRAWEMGHTFLRRGLGTARPLLFVSDRTGATAGERSRRGFSRAPLHCGREYLLTEELPHAVPLAWLLDAPAADAHRSKLLERLAPQVGDRLRLMRDARFVHGDLHAGNLLVSPSAAPLGLWFAGMEAVHRGSRFAWIFRRQFDRMLARLEVDLRGRRAVSATLRIRFLRRLLGAEFRNEWKRVWRRVARHAAKRGSHRIEEEAARA